MRLSLEIACLAESQAAAVFLLLPILALEANCWSLVHVDCPRASCVVEEGRVFVGLLWVLFVTVECQSTHPRRILQ